MEAYPLAMRRRVLAVWDEGGLTQAEVADQFGVSARWLRKLLALRRASAPLAPKPHAGGRVAKVDAAAEQRLRDTLAAQPDATLDELRARLGLAASRTCLSRALRRLKITRKKSASSRPSSATRRWTGRGRRGRTGRPPAGSTRPACSFWTRRTSGRRCGGRWPGPRAGSG